MKFTYLWCILLKCNLDGSLLAFLLKKERSFFGRVLLLTKVLMAASVARKRVTVDTSSACFPVKKIWQESGEATATFTRLMKLSKRQFIAFKMQVLPDSPGIG